MYKGVAEAKNVIRNAHASEGRCVSVYIRSIEHGGQFGTGGQDLFLGRALGLS